MKMMVGRVGKNVEMAKMYNAENADIFVDYGKNASYTRGIIQAGKGYSYLENEGMDKLVVDIKEYLQDEKNWYNRSHVKMFIDGNFSLNDALVLADLEKWCAGLDLTISVQNDSNTISVYELLSQ